MNKKADGTTQAPTPALSADAVEWAIQLVADHSDGDLFPRVAEMSAILERKAELAAEICKPAMGELVHGPHRRFIVPKDDISYRQATQLDPQDSIILSAIVYKYGHGIEKRRRPRDQVFSYRFLPDAVRGFYDNKAAWNDFWRTAAGKSAKFTSVLYCDISDFYNQIYHHSVENQLQESGFPNQVTKWVVSLLESTTAGVSRGVPVGPHAAHLIAEATLIPVDNSMAASGIEFVRYADDIVIFCESEKAAKKALSRLATILDRQQRLTLQRHKTKIFERDDFIAHCGEMIEDRPINSAEDQVLKLVKKYSGGDPYKLIFYNSIKVEDWKLITDDLVRKIIEEYINQDEVDYIRLRWFYRRLAQIGHPGAIDVTLENIQDLGPCFASICTYLSSLQEISKEQWVAIGGSLLELLNLDDVKESEYFRLSILNLFSRNALINHFHRLSDIYKASDPFAKREILLAARINGAVDWLRELKEDFDAMDPWQRWAFIYCCRDLPADEKKFFINRGQFKRPFEIQLAKWAKGRDEQ